MVDVGGDDRAAARDLVADEFGGDVVGDRGAEILAVADVFGERLAAEVLADGDIFHLGRDDAAAGVVHLADVRARLGAQHRRRTLGKAGTPPERSGPSWPLSSGRTSRWVDFLDIAARELPVAAQLGQAGVMSIGASGSV